MAPGAGQPSAEHQQIRTAPGLESWDSPDLQSAGGDCPKGLSPAVVLASQCSPDNDGTLNQVNKVCYFLPIKAEVSSLRPAGQISPLELRGFSSILAVAGFSVPAVRNFTHPMTGQSSSSIQLLVQGPIGPELGHSSLPLENATEYCAVGIVSLMI